MKTTLMICMLIIAASVPAGAQPTGGMSALNYYVGTWACIGGPTKYAPLKATITVAMSGGLMVETVNVGVQAKMDTAYIQNVAVSYDPKAAAYSRTSNDNLAEWSVSKATPWTGNTETWSDVTSSDGKLSHFQTVRTDQDHFTSVGYPTATDTTPDFKATCQRQPS